MLFGFGRATFLLFVILCLTAIAQAQVGIFYPMSPEATGRGGIYASAETDDPLAPMANPGLMGFLAERNRFSAAFFPARTTYDWNQIYRGDGGRYTFASRAVNMGLDSRTLQRLLNTRLPLSVGLGYQESDFHFPEMMVSFAQDSSRLIHPRQYARGFGVGVGLHTKYLQAGLGWNQKYFTLDWGYEKARNTAADFGIAAQTPLSSYLCSSMETGKWRPFITPSVGLALNNEGGQYRYSRDTHGSPLPRQSSLSLGIAAGLRASRESGEDMEIIGVRVGEQMVNALVNSDNNGNYTYRKIFGHLQPINDLLLGKPRTTVGRNQGIEVSVLETAILRWGHIRLAEPGYSGFQYSTNGIGLRISGLVKMMSASSAANDTSPASLLLRHLDVQYACATQHIDAGYNAAVDGMNYHEITLLWKN